MAVNIEFALCNGKLVHIDDRISKENEYYCPSCLEMVIAKKGIKNTHHFAHKPNSSCTANEETLLHFYAKHYLVSLKDEVIPFYFPLNFFNDIQGIIPKIAWTSGIESIPIRFNNILSFFGLHLRNGLVEHQIGNYVADVLFFDPEENVSELVIEVFVTHSIEGNKRNYFLEDQIPFIEVTPSIVGSQIKFNVTDMYLPNYIEEYERKSTKELLYFAYNKYNDVLVKQAKKQIYNYEQIQIQKEAALEELKNDIENINFRDYINGQLYKKMISIPVSAFNFANYVEEVKAFRMNKRYLLCNNLFVNHEARILHSVLENFKNEGIQMEAFIEEDPLNHKKSVTGFNFLIPSTQVTGEVMKDILKDMLAKLVSI